MSTSDPTVAAALAGLRLHHVGVIVPDFAAAADYMALFGHAEDYRGHVDEFECWCIFLKAPAGHPAVELVVPTGGPLAKFNRGAGGLHHYAYEVADIVALQAYYAARDIAMLRAEPVKGAGDFLCNFLSPIATRGVLVEFVQRIAGPNPVKPG
jgi:catechol 2,3-dioxygenase-like lactoylglutathione lyase family enzyme